MHICSDTALNDAALSYPDPALRALLSRLLAAISCDGEFDPAELVRLVIIEPGDTLEAVNTGVGYALTPDWEACGRDGDWIALTFVLSDWGEGLLVFIPDQPNIDPAFLGLCSVTPENR